jgi:DNA-binding transcriptional regulator GbsR (MarR family)
MNQEERGALRRHMIDACVKAANNKGCCDAVGVLRGTLFLETKPMSMDRLVEETGYSKSTVSSNMNLLETLGLARRVVIPGDKRYHYVLVTDPDSLRKAMLVHIKNEIQLILSALDKTEKDLKDSERELAEISKRIESIRHFYRQTERLLSLLARHTTDELVEILEKAEK